MIRVQPRIVCFLPSFIYQLKLHFSWIFIFTLILTVCYLFGYSILGVYGYCSHVNDARKTDTLVKSPKGEKVCWQINQYPSLRTIKNKTASCGQKQTSAEAGIFLLDASKVLIVETILMKMINFRLSWHLSSILVNVSWLDSCMGSFRRNTFSLKALVIKSTGESYKGRPDPPFRFPWSPALIPLNPPLTWEYCSSYISL